MGLISMRGLKRPMKSPIIMLAAQFLFFNVAIAAGHCLFFHESRGHHKEVSFVSDRRRHEHEEPLVDTDCLKGLTSFHALVGSSGFHQSLSFLKGQSLQASKPIVLLVQGLRELWPFSRGPDLWPKPAESLHKLISIYLI